MNFFTCPNCFEESACGCPECSTKDLLVVRMKFVDDDKTERVECPHCKKITFAEEWLELSEEIFKAKVTYKKHINKHKT